MCCEDLEYVEFEIQSTPTARKIHNCSECQSNIFPGQKYYKATGKVDGEFYTYKRCDRCSKISSYIESKLNCFCFGQGLLQEAIDYLNKGEKAKLNIVKAKYCRVNAIKDSYYDNLHPSTENGNRQIK